MSKEKPAAFYSPEWGCLVNKAGALLAPGDEVRSSDGEEFILIHAVEPHKPSSTGRVIVRPKNGGADRTYFPNVIGAGWSAQMVRR